MYVMVSALWLRDFANGNGATNDNHPRPTPPESEQYVTVVPAGVIAFSGVTAKGGERESKGLVECFT